MNSARQAEGARPYPVEHDWLEAVRDGTLAASWSTLVVQHGRKAWVEIDIDDVLSDQPDETRKERNPITHLAKPLFSFLSCRIGMVHNMP